MAEQRLLCVIGGVIILIFCTGSEPANARSRGHDKAWLLRLIPGLAAAGKIVSLTRSRRVVAQ